jgi:peptidyl-dipeptidase Dcp
MSISAASPGGLFDPQVAERFQRTILDVGNLHSLRDAFRNFRGRDPDPDALFRRFGLTQVRD